jgi:xanthine dehydrogenase accessory factor
MIVMQDEVRLEPWGGGGLEKKIVQESLEALKEGKAQRKGIADIDDLYSEDMESYAERLSPASNAYIIIVTRGFSKDKAALEHLIAKDFRYAGMAGSGRKISTIREDLISKGMKKEHLSKLHAPIDLDIAAETPQEIAVTTAAEIISVKRGKRGN